MKLILKHAPKDLDKAGLSTSDIKDLARVCNQFSNLCLEIPIISVYETVPSKVRGSGIFGRLLGSNRVVSSIVLFSREVCAGSYFL